MTQRLLKGGLLTFGSKIPLCFSPTKPWLPREAMVAQPHLIGYRFFLTDLPDKKGKMGINDLVEQGISEAQSLEIRYGLLTCWLGFGKVTQMAFVK